MSDVPIIMVQYPYFFLDIGFEKDLWGLHNPIACTLEIFAYMSLVCFRVTQSFTQNNLRLLVWRQMMYLARFLH